MATGAQEAAIDDNETDVATVATPPLSTQDSELETLKQALEDSRKREQASAARAEAAERARSETTQRLTAETGNRISAEEIAINNAIAANATEAEKIEAEIIAAQENGKFAEAAKLMRRLASVQSKLDGWEEKKTQFQQQREAQKTAKPETDPLAGYTPATREWINRHPQFLNDTAYNAKAMAAHFSAIAQGIVLDSPEYFGHIEAAVEDKKPAKSDAGNESSVREREIGNSAARTAAPPSRGMSGNGMTKQGNGQIKLSPEQVEAAIFSFPKLSAADAMKKYADGLTRAQGEGKMTTDGRYAG